MEPDAPKTIHRPQWIMLAAAWLCGMIFVFANVLAEADFAACIASYDYGLDWETSELRPANWPVGRYVAVLARTSPVLVFGGALVILPLAVFLLCPRHQADSMDWIVLILSILPLVLLTVFLDTGQECDRKGTDHFLPWLIVWPSQIVAILIISTVRWLVRQMGRR